MFSDTLVTIAADGGAIFDSDATIIERVSAPSTPDVRQIAERLAAGAQETGRLSWFPRDARKHLATAAQSTQVGDMLPTPRREVTVDDDACPTIHVPLLVTRVVDAPVRELCNPRVVAADRRTTDRHTADRRTTGRSAAAEDREVLTAHLPVPMDVDDLIAEERPRAASLQACPLPTPLHVRDLIERGHAPDPRYPVGGARRSSSSDFVGEPEVSSPMVVPVMDFCEEDLAGPVPSGQASHWNVPLAPSSLRARSSPRGVPVARVGRRHEVARPAFAHEATKTFHYDAIPTPKRTPPRSRALDEDGEVKPQRDIRTQIVNPASLRMAPDVTQATGLARFASTVLLDFDSLTKPPVLVAPFVFLGLGLAFLLFAAVQVM